MNTAVNTLASDSSRTIDVAGTKIHYHDAGEGPALVLLHGSGPGASGWSNFNRNVPQLARQFRVLCIDMPGWGQSDPREKGIEFLAWYAEKLVGLLDALDIRKAHGVGNSLGGSVLMKAALDHPDHFEKIVIMGAPIGFNLFGQLFSPAVQEIFNFYEGDGPTRARLENFVDNFVYDRSGIDDKLLDDRLASALEFKDNPPMRITAQDRMEKLWQHPSLPALPHDVLLIWGREDVVVPLDRGLSALTLIPKARLYVMPHCGHWVQWEHPEEFNSVVANFIAG